MTLEIKLHEDQTIWCTGSPTIKKEGNIISSKLGDLDCGIVDYPYDIAYSVILEEEGAKIIDVMLEKTNNFVSHVQIDNVILGEGLDSRIDNSAPGTLQSVIF